MEIVVLKKRKGEVFPPFFESKEVFIQGRLLGLSEDGLSGLLFFGMNFTYSHKKPKGTYISSENEKRGITSCFPLIVLCKPTKDGFWEPKKTLKGKKIVFGTDLREVNL